MALDVDCFRCERVLDKPGALLFGPPIETKAKLENIQTSQKFHLCIACYCDIIEPILGVHAAKRREREREASMEELSDWGEDRSE